MVRLDTRHDVAALIKLIREESDGWYTDGLANLVWALHRTANDPELDLPILRGEEVDEILAVYEDDN